MTSGIPTTPVLPESVNFCLDTDVIEVSSNQAMSPSETRGKKRVTASEESVRKSQRGKNWSEGDSILLVQAYKWIEENKKGTTTFTLPPILIQKHGKPKTT